MKNKSIVTFYLVLMLFLLGSPMAFAGHGNGAMDGTGPMMNITTGTAVEISGMVISIGIPGAGMSIDTGNEIATVYGIGPQRYWDAMGVPRPEVGEEVTVSGYEVTLSDGTTRIIATSITIDGQTIDLRDTNTGVPLWRGGPNRPN